MNRIAGVFVLLVVMYVALLASTPPDIWYSNLIDLANRQGLWGVMTLGVAVLIVAGGIDLSIGSVIGLSAVAFGLLMEAGYHPLLSLAATLGIGVLIGLAHGLLVTKLRLQPFIVTLCGLFVYRGLSRYVATGAVGLERIKKARPASAGVIDQLQYALVGESPAGLQFPAMFAVMLVLAAVLGLVLHKTVYGRYWYAIGYNEQAARYSGIAVDRQRIAVFVISSTCAALCGVLWLLSKSDANPESAGASYELYAITGAVLGGCSLRGGEGTALGMVLGAMVLPLLQKLVVFLGIGDAILPTVIGLTLLAGVMVDEALRGGTRLSGLFARLRPKGSGPGG